MKLLINHKISKHSIDLLSNAGFDIDAVTVAQSQLTNYINEHHFEALITNTPIDKKFIEECPKIKLIGCPTNNNIDLEHAIKKNIEVVYPSEAYSVAVAELVFAHLLGMVRFLHQTNREMPLEGDVKFKDFKKHFSSGIELQGKTLGIIGFGNIGKEVAKIAIGLGMKVIATSTEIKKETIAISFFDGRSISFDIETKPLDFLVKNADFITLHTPAQVTPIIDKKEIDLMKTGVGIINTSKGSNLNEVALIDAILSDKIKYAALDVFENEPNPEIPLLMNPEISLSPHIGAGTVEAKHKAEKILIDKFIEYSLKAL
jgi:D-3-phosphoglycerate dehydrogenase